MTRWIHVRPQRGGLDSAMREHKTIPATQEEINKFFSMEWEGEEFSVEPYSDRPDNRISWPCTWIVMGKGGPVGFCSGDIVRSPEML